jgi:signal transduction histidine kinase
MMTAGSRDRERVFRGYEAGAVDFLFKPIEPAILMNKVETFVQLYRQRLELEHTLKLNEMFMAVLGHDLRNPVSAVVTLGKLLAASQDPAVVRESAERLRSIGTRMGRMINDLLDLARARQGGIPVSPRSTELCALISRTVDELRLVHADREVRLELPEAPMTGEWDADRLAQLLENLVSNALKHGPEDRPVGITLLRDGDVAVVCVANEGSIDAALLPHVFNPFRSGSERRQNGAEEGLGLGLYIVHQIALAHGGSVTATSQDGVVKFTARLPLTSQSEPAED